MPPCSKHPTNPVDWYCVILTHGVQKEMTIELSEGFKCELDDCDAHLVLGKKLKLIRKPPSRTLYVGFFSNRKIRTIHREILNPPPGKQVDHINGNGLDNRRSNLRLATKSQNMANVRLTKSNKSGVKGVHWRNREKRWVAQLTFQGKTTQLGYFRNIQDAQKKYDDEALKFFGEFAKTNRDLIQEKEKVRV